jgi:hypothetical protein
LSGKKINEINKPIPPYVGRDICPNSFSFLKPHGAIMASIKSYLGLDKPTTAALDEARADLKRHRELLSSASGALETAEARAKEATDTFASKADCLAASQAAEAARAAIARRNAAIANTTARIAELEAKAAAEQSTANRKARADAYAKHLLEKELWDSKLLAVLREGHDIIHRNVEMDGPDTVPLSILFSNLTNELPEAFKAQSLRIKDNIKAILDGRLPEHAPKQAPAPVKPVIAAPKPTTLCFTFQPIVFTNPTSGERDRIGRGAPVRLLDAEAAIAIQRGKCAAHDPRDRKQAVLASQRSSQLPEWFHCYSLIEDAMMPQPNITLGHTAKSTSFDPATMAKFNVEVTRGPAYTGTIAATQPAAAAARTNKKGESHE